ncbi:hypothetical protein J2Z40_001836 [Cytobacillus eiseniae]|uniref:Group-specific protein n=1 Tax=Cytobacillus eiseniae TaxID=762947 RepID=A0ABS4RG21_9BACI|nr:hypothetical protein [Cytobacillus eiseniae]MBP2241274.1 hypothetical protein [Cytobacillus eiseniae]
MFDPTAFENMKVVLDGAIYDEDISGKVQIIDRNDLLNIAKLSRKYEITFTDSIEKKIHCTFMMEAGLENLAAELLPIAQTNRLAGCHLFVKFSFDHPNEVFTFQKINQILKEIWGSDRTITQTATLFPFKDTNIIKNETIISFNRIVYEDQIDDILLMIDYMMISIEKLRGII